MFVSLTEIRIEAVRAAAKVSLAGGVGSLLVHARWLEDYIVSGRIPSLPTTSSVAGDCIPKNLRPKGLPRS
jgi:hypothetical protein